MEKRYEIDFTLEELEVLQIALNPNEGFCRALAFNSKEKGLDIIKRLELAASLRKRITSIININTLNKQ